MVPVVRMPAKTRYQLYLEMRVEEVGAWSCELAGCCYCHIPSGDLGLLKWPVSLTLRKSDHSMFFFTQMGDGWIVEQKYCQVKARRAKRWEERFQTARTSFLGVGVQWIL